MTRPLWECHLIEGLENRRYALYFKAHHCAIDGMGAVRMLRKWLTLTPTDMDGFSRLARSPTMRFTPSATHLAGTPAQAGPHRRQTGRRL